MDTVQDSSFSNQILVIPEIMVPRKSYVQSIRVFFIGIFGLSLGYVLASTTYSFTFIYQAMELASLFLIFFSLFNLLSLKAKYTYFTFITSIYLLWQVLILVKGDFSTLDYFYLKQLLFDLNYGGFVLFIPIVAFVPLKLVVLKKMFEIIFLFSLVFLFLAFLNLQTLLNPDLLSKESLGTIEAYGKYLVFPVGLLAMNFDLLNKRYKVLVAVTLLSILFFAVFRARRGLLLIQLTFITCSAVIYFYKTNKKLSIFLSVLYAFAFIGTYLSSSSAFLQGSFFKNLTTRGLEDTRSFVENCFYKDMTMLDWVIGKGYNSGYRCPGVDDAIFKDGIRTVIETDYLQLIMIGGIVNLVLLFLCILPAVYLGLFKSKSMVAKSFALWIIIWLFSLYPANVYSLNLYHISIWICAGFCYSKPFRELTQLEISSYFLKEINPKKIKLKSEKA